MSVALLNVLSVFVAVTLERMVRLSYLERIEKAIPSAFVPLLPPRPTRPAAAAPPVVAPPPSRL